jgi:hypothetical protein
VSADKVPLLHLKRKVGTNWEYSSNLTSVYLDILHEIATAGTTFKDKNALLTGVGKGSIGVEVVKGLLSGGAHVVITTSRYIQLPERLIELSPFPTLTGMATRTLKAKYEVQDDCVFLTREFLCHAKHSKEIYYLFEDEARTVGEVEPEVESAPAPASVASTLAPVTTPTPVAVSGP